MCLYDLVNVHHKGEEEDLFPKIEAMTGENGIMDTNVEATPGVSRRTR